MSLYMDHVWKHGQGPCMEGLLDNKDLGVYFKCNKKPQKGFWEEKDRI